MVLPVPGGELTTTEVLRSSEAARSSTADANASPRPILDRSNGALITSPVSRVRRMRVRRRSARPKLPRAANRILRETPPWGWGLTQ